MTGEVRTAPDEETVGGLSFAEFQEALRGSADTYDGVWIDEVETGRGDYETQKKHAATAVEQVLSWFDLSPPQIIHWTDKLTAVSSYREHADQLDAQTIISRLQNTIALLKA